MRLQEMSWLNNEITKGRLLVLLLAICCPLIVMLSTGLFRKYPLNLRARALSTVVLAIIYTGIVMTQMWAFRRVAHVKPVTSDDFVFLVLFLENLISIGLLFYRLRKSGRDLFF